MSRTGIIISVMTAFMLSLMAANAAPMDFEPCFDEPVEVQLTTTSFEMHNNSDDDGGGHGQADPVFTPMKVAIQYHGIDVNVYYMSLDNGAWDDPDADGNDTDDGANDDDSDDADNNGNNTDDDETGDVNVTEPGILDYGMSTYAGVQMNEIYMSNVHMCVNDSDDSADDDDDATDPGNNGTDPNQRPPVFVPHGAVGHNMVSSDPMMRY